MFVTMAALALLSGCGDKEAETGAPVPVDTADTVEDTDTADTGEPVPTIPDGLVGTIDFHTFGEYAEVNILKAFGLAMDGKFIAYLSNNKDATCDDALQYVTPSDKPWDPSGLLTPGSCDMFMSLVWKDGFEAKNDALSVAGFSIFCPLGDGEFVYEKRDTGDTDYFWSGRWWQGHPEDYSLTITEDSDSYTFTMDMSTFDGSLIYEDFSAYTGVGRVWGVLPIERCEAMKGLHSIY